MAKTIAPDRTFAKGSSGKQGRTHIKAPRKVVTAPSLSGEAGLSPFEVEQDIWVQMPSKQEYPVKLKIVRTERPGPAPIPEEYFLLSDI